MVIYAKVGTHPQSRVKVKGKRNKPAVGERIKVKLDAHYSPQTWTEVIVDEIRDMGSYDLYFVSKA